jgi:REP element-mobilizing transposase RayT
MSVQRNPELQRNPERKRRVGRARTNRDALVYSVGVTFPPAYFLTWRTHGTWLHGDERGAVDDRFNQFNTPPLEANPNRAAWEAGRLRTPPVVLERAARRVVNDTIVLHCAIRHWTIHALNVRTTHVHTVVACGPIEPEPALDQLKSWCTRRLREAGLFGTDAKLWVYHGSTRYLWDRVSLEAAVKYVTEEQGPPLLW